MGRAGEGAVAGGVIFSMRVVYSKHYDISFFGIERLHPFDSRKYGRAYRELRRRFGQSLRGRLATVDRAARYSELLLGHSEDYLGRIRNREALAAALELPELSRAPEWLLRWRVVRPMRWAVRGTIIAAELAMREGLAINLSGGYHHAKPSYGEGFCLFNDIAISVRAMRHDRLLSEESRIVYIDLDAHQGNGVCHEFMDDARTFIFDMYNCEIYPCYDVNARERIDCDVGLRGGISGCDYLAKLRNELPAFLDSLSGNTPIALAIYNAGTDVVMGDPLGDLELSPVEVLERDLFVIGQLRSRNIPAVMLPSGGYTRDSYQLIAATVSELIK
jgi:histone deacetylase 11